MMLAFGLAPSHVRASEEDPPPVPVGCSGLDGGQGPLFFVPSSNSDPSLVPTPASSSTVVAGSTVYAVYHDETKLLDTVGDTVPGPVHNLTFTYTGPSSGTVTPIFTALPAGTGFSTMIPSAGRAWRPPGAARSGLDPHPDQEFDYVVKISGVIPNLTTSGDYLFRLETRDGDNNAARGAGDCGFAEWRLHVKAQPQITTTPSLGRVVGTLIHDTATVTGGQSPTGTVTFTLYAPGDTVCESAVFTDTKPLGVASGAYATTAAGTYRWKARYNGDANNATATSGCQEELVTVSAPPVTVSTPPVGGTQPGAAGEVKAATITLPNTGTVETAGITIMWMMMVLVGVVMLGGVFVLISMRKNER
jgi:hypothetical protein